MIVILWGRAWGFPGGGTPPPGNAEASNSKFAGDNEHLNFDGDRRAGGGAQARAKKRCVVLGSSSRDPSPGVGARDHVESGLPSRRCDEPDGFCVVKFDLLIDFLRSMPKQCVVVGKFERDDPLWRPRNPGVLEIFAGSSRFTRAAVRSGARWGVRIDIGFGSNCDLRSQGLRARILDLIGAGHRPSGPDVFGCPGSCGPKFGGALGCHGCCGEPEGHYRG